MYKPFLFLLIFIQGSLNVFSQCDNQIPFHFVDLTADLNSAVTLTVGSQNALKCCNDQADGIECEIIQIWLNSEAQGFQISADKNACSLSLYEGASCPLFVELDLCDPICVAENNLQFTLCKEGVLEESSLTFRSIACCLGQPFLFGQPCAGSSFTLRSNVTDPNTSFEWFDEEPVNASISSFSNEARPTVSGLEAGSYTFWLILKNADCETEPMPLTIEVLPSPSVTASMSGGDCGENIQLMAEVDPPGDYTFLWSGPNNFFSSSQNTEIIEPDQSSIGTYVLNVFSNDGCNAPTASIDILEVEEFNQELDIFSTALFICEGQELTLFTNLVAGDDITYTWTHTNLLGQVQTYTTTSPTIIFDVASETQNGVYSVSASNGNCSTDPSPLFEVEVQVIPVPVINAQDSYCSGDDIVLSSLLIDGATYLWTGPNGLTSSDTDFIIPAAGLSDAGLYALQINLNGCSSELSTIQIEITEGISETLNIFSTSFTSCEGDAYTLFTNFIDGTDIVYAWTHINLMGQSLTFTTSEPSLVFNELSMEQAGVYSVIATNGTCESNPAELFELEVFSLPAAPQIVGESNLCEGDNLLLTAKVTDPLLTFDWSGPNGFTSNETTIDIKNLPSSMAGPYTLQVSSNGCNSETTIVNVLLNPIPPSFTIANDGPVCEGDSIKFFVLNADAAFIYTWIDAQSNTTLGQGEEINLAPNLIENGQLISLQIANQEGCIYDALSVNDTDGQAEIEIIPVPLESADAGQNGISCDGTYGLEAIELSLSGNAFGFWSNVNGEIMIDDPLNPNTTASNLNIGENILLWQIENDVCGIVSTDTLLVTYIEAPILGDDEFMTSSNTTLESIDLFTNDEFINEFFIVSEISKSDLGELLENGDGTYEFIPNQNASGTASFVYTICAIDCSDFCFDANLKINIEGNTDCLFPTVITPNGDNYNDALSIYCIESFEGSSIQIFNRWGETVYESMDYKNDWEGTYNSEPLPVGTYFYILTMNDEGKTKHNGHVYLQR